VTSRLQEAPQRIAGERVVLEPLRVADAPEMTGVLADPSLYDFIGGEPPDVDTLRGRYEQLVAGGSGDGAEEWFNWVVRSPDGAAVGTVQATVTADGDHAEVAWVVGTPWQGRGYASDAASTLVRWLLAGGVTVVVAHVHPDHAASEAVARRAGLSPTDVMAHGERRWQLAAPPPAETLAKD
jgi:RimJ/RimL family protein N-acetyltransferase